MRIPGPAVRIAAVAAIAVIGLIGLVAFESFERARGAEAILAMEVADPRTPLSGNYAAISLADTVQPGQPCPPGIATIMPFTGMQPPLQWIALKRSGDHSVVAGVADSRDAAARYSPVVVRGRANCVPSEPASGGTPGTEGSVSLDIGVDRFYASQAEAERISAISEACEPGSNCPIAAIVSIGADGRARLKGLIVNGQRIEMGLF